MLYTYQKHIEIFLICIFLLTVLIFGISNAQKLDLLIEEALIKNPEIQVFELKYQVATEKVNEANTLPNTQLGVGYFARHIWDTFDCERRFVQQVKNPLVHIRRCIWHGH